MSQQGTAKKEEIFPTRLKATRLRQGWTQQDLSNRTGFSLSSIGNWETPGTIPSPNKLGKLAQILGCTIGYLTGEDELVSNESITPYRVNPSDDDVGYRQSLRSLAKNKTRPDLYLSDQIHKMLEEEEPQLENFIVARAGAKELIEHLEKIISEKRKEPNSSQGDVSGKVLKRAAELVKSPGVSYLRSHKADETTGKVYPPTSGDHKHQDDQP